jgi:glyoxylase-like metal-dependent hydrolase (beta-lactamase superfamily II)
MKFVYEWALAASAALTIFSSSGALASAPMATSGSAGVFRMHLGDFEITALSDGTVDLPMSKLLTGIKPADYQKIIARNFLTDPVETSDTAYLINTGSKLVLVDTGAGKLFGPTLGKTVANLKASGYQPEQVDAILITHMHPDHVGGLVAEDKLVFPNATVYVDQAESDFWLSTANMEKAPAENKGFFQGAMASVNPYVKAGKVKYLTGETEIVPGVKSHPSHGHTAGHTTYIVESNGKRLVLMGDLVHFGAAQFENPSIRIGFDTDQKNAESERRAAFTSAAKDADWMCASHLPFPGIGHVRAEKKAFVYIPANYMR